MPNLPAVPVTQPQLDRLIASLPGANLAEKTESYQVLVTNAMIDFVEATEFAKIETRVNADRKAALAEVQAAMPPRLPFPPDFTTTQKGD